MTMQELQVVQEAAFEPFHQGEREVQARAGTRARLEVAGRHLIRDHMPDQHRELFEKLPWMIVGVADASGQPWATVVTGKPGFVSTTARSMRINSLPLMQDPARRALLPGARVGLLGLEPSTRRRNRMNGRLSTVSAGSMTIDVRQSFGNCPKYIRMRQHRYEIGGQAPVRVDLSPALDHEAMALIRQADTFFIATASGVRDLDGAGGLDVSHRGGPAGFVDLDLADGRAVLTFPDFAGNGFFNTFGNLLQEPRAGLVFIDFARGHLLQLSALGLVGWDGVGPASPPATNRALTLTVTGGHWLRNALDLRWD
jgi:predicted pyridoxine 5'-phosphate oxidase superfamily flavin-nucleotide-binding protein